MPGMSDSALASSSQTDRIRAGELCTVCVVAAYVESNRHRSDVTLVSFPRTQQPNRGLFERAMP